jgi:flagellar protein FliO/FliZ
MNRATFPKAALLGAVMTALLPAAALAAPPAGVKAYLASVRPQVADDAVDVALRVRGSAIQSLAFRPGAVQLTLEGAFLDPAKQHVPVDHPAVREVFAYQYDPDTVRVRVVTEGLDARALERGVTLTAEGGTLHLRLAGLPTPPPAKKDNGPAARTRPKAAVRPAPAPPAVPVKPAADLPVQAEAGKPEPPKAPAPKANAAPAARPEAIPAPVPETTARMAAEARTEALHTLERILAPASAPEGAPPPRLVRLTPEEALLGGGSPAVRERTAKAAAPKDETAPAPAPEAEPEATAAPQPETFAPAAPAPPEAPVEGERHPLRTLPASGAAPSLWASGARMAGGLLVVLALLVGGLALLRRFKGTALGGRVPIRVLASASVGSRQNIVVVDVEGRRLVVGVGPGGTELLADLDGAPGTGEPATTGPAPAPRPTGAPDSPFARALKRAGERGTRDAIARTRRDLEERIRLLKARSA